MAARKTLKIAGAADKTSLVGKVNVTGKSLVQASVNKVYRGEDAQRKAKEDRVGVEVNEEFEQIYIHAVNELTDDGTLYNVVKGNRDVISGLIKKSVESQMILFSRGGDDDLDEVTNYLSESYFRSIGPNLKVTEDPPTIGKPNFAHQKVFTEENIKYLLGRFEDAAAFYYRAYSMDPEKPSITFDSYLRYFRLYMCSSISNSKSLNDKVKEKLISTYGLDDVYDVAKTEKGARAIIDSFLERVRGYNNDYNKRKKLAKKVFEVSPHFATLNSDYYLTYQAAMK